MRPLDFAAKPRESRLREEEEEEGGRPGEEGRTPIHRRGWRNREESLQDWKGDRKKSGGGGGGGAPFLERRAGPSGILAGGPTGSTAGASERDERQPWGQGTGRWPSPSSGGAGRPRHLARSGGPLERSQTVLAQRMQALAGAQRPSASPRGWQRGVLSGSRVSRRGGWRRWPRWVPLLSFLSFRRVARPQGSGASAVLGAAHPPGCSMTHGRSCCSGELLPKAPGAKRPADAAGGRANQPAAALYWQTTRRAPP